MTDFDLSGFSDPPPLPPLDPMVAREEKIANDTRVESELNKFIAAKQDALFTAPDAYYRKQGRDAVDSALTMIRPVHVQKALMQSAPQNVLRNMRWARFLDQNGLPDPTDLA